MASNYQDNYNNISGNRADAFSRQTDFAGLPKAVKLVNPGNPTQAAPATGVAQSMGFAGYAFNYGGFSLRAGTAGRGTGGYAYDGVIVNEPGVYEVLGQIGFIANSQLVAGFIYQNGSPNLLDATAAEFFTGAILGNGAYVVGQHVHTFLECSAQDVLSLVEVQTTSGGSPAGTSGQYTWLYVEKKGGQY